MKQIALFLIALMIAGCKGTPGSSGKLETEKDKISYALGLNIGKRMRTDSLEIVPAMFLRGLQDAMDDSSKKLLSDQDVKTVLVTLDQGLAMKRMVLSSATAEKNKKEGEAFLEENKKRPGVVTLPSGLQYEVITDGTGKSPRANQTVTVKYRGTLINGTEFDSSELHGGNSTFQLSQMIPGWIEALQKMKVGSKWKLFIPDKLAYGDRSAGPTIGPNSTLIFELELLDVK